jgi:glycosyltransferase involved in cell wall biosynthesis
MIKFTIITVSLNAGNDLIDTAESVLSQDYKNYEIIIKDGFSIDGSIEKLPYNENIRLIQKKDNGIYDAMNQALEEATGDYVLFINAGDKLANTDILDKLNQIIDKENNLFYYGHCYNETLNVYSNAPKKLTPFFCFRTMLCHQAMIFSKKVFENKRYNCAYKISADKELLLYVVVGKKYKTNYIPLTIANYKGSGFCEKEENQSLMKNESLNLKKEYFTRNQIFWYSFLIKLTFPRLRSLILSNKKIIRHYKKIVGLIYGNKRKG